MTSAEKIANAKKRIEELERLINCWDKSEQKKSHIVRLAKRLHYSQPRNNSPKRKPSKRKQEIRYNTETQVNEI